MKDITRKRLRKLHYPFLGYAEHCSLCYEMAHDWDDEVEYRHPDDPYYTTVDQCDLCGDRSAGIRWIAHAHDCHRFDPVHLVLCEKCADIVQDIQDQWLGVAKVDGLESEKERIMGTYMVTVVPILDSCDGIPHTVCVTDVWDIAIAAADYCRQYYPVRHPQDRVDINSAINGVLYARWHVSEDRDGVRTDVGGFLDREDRV